MCLYIVYRFERYFTDDTRILLIPATITSASLAFFVVIIVNIHSVILQYFSLDID